MESTNPPLHKLIGENAGYKSLLDQLGNFKTILPDTNPPQHSKDTVVVRYWVLGGNPTSDEPMKSFTFLQPAPRFVCKPFDPESVDIDMKDLRDAPEEFQIWAGFSKDLFSKYNKEVGKGLNWPCVACNKPATALRSSSYHLLSPEPETNTAGFVPMALSVAVPVCPRPENGGVCSNEGFVMAQNFGMKVMVNNPWRIWDEMKICQKCGSNANIQLCGGCKMIGSVSR
jgi:hypothetical protein